MCFLICNAGSSSLKCSLIDPPSERTLAEADIAWKGASARLTLRVADRPPQISDISAQDRPGAIATILRAMQQGGGAPISSLHDIQAVGHRVVHGGDRYVAPVLITPEVRYELGTLSQLAPLHNAASLDVIDAVHRVFPPVPQMAAFDTAFHATLPESARTYPVPYHWTADWRLRRYGFHGLSHAYCASRAAQMLPGRDLKLIIAHLGNGASISAVRSGVCIDTSMGFTPMEGLMMGTRCGSVDPGLLIHVLRHKGLGVDQLDAALNHESGLLGVSGISADMRDVLAAMAENPRARLAVDIYVQRIQKAIGAMAAALGGVDALVFTAGIGEHAAVIRQRVCEKLGFLGLELDRRANQSATPDVDIATRTSTARILVLTSREDLVIVREMCRLMQRDATRENVHDRGNR